MSIIITKQCEGLAEIRNHTFPEFMFVYLKMKSEKARRLKGRCLLANMFLVLKNSKKKFNKVKFFSPSILLKIVVIIGRLRYCDCCPSQKMSSALWSRIALYTCTRVTQTSTLVPGEIHINGLCRKYFLRKGRESLVISKLWNEFVHQITLSWYCSLRTSSVVWWMRKKRHPSFPPQICLSSGIFQESPISLHRSQSNISLSAPSCLAIWICHWSYKIFPVRIISRPSEFKYSFHVRSFLHVVLNVVSMWGVSRTLQVTQRKMVSISANSVKLYEPEHPNNIHKYKSLFFSCNKSSRSSYQELL